MRDYWSFPAIMESFKATKWGKFKTIDGLEWRIRGGDYCLVTPPQSIFRIPKDANRDRARSLSFIEGCIGKDVPKKDCGKVFWTNSAWTPNRKTRYEVRLAEREGAELVLNPMPEEVASCVDWWIADLAAAKPNTMIVKNHYYKMIQQEGIEFIACRCKGEIIGASGYTVDGEDGAICFTKCTRSYRWVSRLLWTFSIQNLINSGCKFINCGDTADRFKKELGLGVSRQYKVDFSKLEQQDAQDL